MKLARITGLKSIFRRSLKMRQEEEKELAEDEERVIGSGGLPPFWKPSVIGEWQEGELMAIRTLDLGDVLHVRAEGGMIGIPVSTTLAEINFHPFIGRSLRFKFMGTADTKAGYKAKLFRVTVLKKRESDEVPF
jgi:hypothetical protein